MRIIGIDASLRCTGYGVIESAAGRLRAVDFGIVHHPASRPHSACLRAIHEKLADVLRGAPADAVAMEGGFFFKNAKTAMVLGEARGVVIAACAVAGVPVFEYSPRAVKQSLTGFGAAGKDQVSKMVMSILGLKESPPEDAADALAMALCHLHSQTTIESLRPRPI